VKTISAIVNFIVFLLTRALGFFASPAPDTIPVVRITCWPTIFSTSAKSYSSVFSSGSATTPIPTNPPILSGKPAISKDGS
jgi:hypothetical protein